ncbi:hypothetical protein LZ32DRAFT_113224 [Colletotrichum eremochloae]|nr:hypothetical protein LZ32DRAFT_113224 [Colletotrichum eremochloae]
MFTRQSWDSRHGKLAGTHSVSPEWLEEDLRKVPGSHWQGCFFTPKVDAREMQRNPRRSGGLGRPTTDLHFQALRPGVRCERKGCKETGLSARHGGTEKSRTLFLCLPGARGTGLHCSRPWTAVDSEIWRRKYCCSLRIMLVRTAPCLRASIKTVALSDLEEHEPTKSIA